MPDELPKNETTNAVLKEMISGLSKITDERFSNLKDGIAEIKLLMQGFVHRSELDEVRKDFVETVRFMREAAVQHNVDDKEAFTKITANNESTKDTIKLWKGISIGVSLIGSPIVTVAIAYVIFFITKK